MKTNELPYLVALLITPLLTQCIVVDENGNAVSGSTNTPSANVSGNAQNSQQVFDLGVRKGLNDEENGLSRNPGRHAGQFPAAESDAFNMGYEKGYNQGTR